MSTSLVFLFTAFGFIGVVAGQLCNMDAIVCLVGLGLICYLCQVFKQRAPGVLKLKTALGTFFCFFFWSFFLQTSSLEETTTLSTWTPVRAHLLPQKAWVDTSGYIHLQTRLKNIQDDRGHRYKELESHTLYIRLPKNTSWEEAWDLSTTWTGLLKITVLGKLKFKPKYSQPSSIQKPIVFWQNYTSLIHSHWKQHVLHLAKEFPGEAPGNSLLLAMLGAGPCNLYVDFLLSRFGLKHLTAISGLHFSIVTLALLTLLYKTPVPLRLFASFAGTTLFLLATGLSGSSTRAWMMSLIACYCLCSGKSYESLKALCITALFWVTVYPSWSLNPGFILSYLCTFLLILVAKLQQQPLGDQLQKTSTWLSAIAWQTWIFLGTAPFLLYWFHCLSWLSLPANLFIAPLLALAFLMSALATFFFWVPVLGPLLWAGASYLCAFILKGLDQISLGWDVSIYYSLSKQELGLYLLLLFYICFRLVQQLFPDSRLQTSSRAFIND